MNSTQVEGISSLYPYKAMLCSLLEFSQESKDTQGRAAGFYKEEPGKLDQADNAGHIARRKWCNGGCLVEVAGPLWVDIFQQSRYIFYLE